MNYTQDDDSKIFLRGPVRSSQELLRKLEEEQTIGWHAVSRPKDEWSVLLGELIRVVLDVVERNEEKEEEL